MFLDGSLEATVSNSSNFSNAAARIGATWDGVAAYARLDDVRITKGSARYTAAFTPPTEEFWPATAVSALALAAGPLGAVQVVGALPVYGSVADSGVLRALSALGGVRLRAIAAAGGPLAQPSASGVHDFTAQLDPSGPLRYRAHLITPDGAVEVPISSWQATLRVDSASYVQCVVPACTPYLDALGAATEFVVMREGALLGGGTVLAAMARGPAQTLQYDQGPRNYTATLSGYPDAVLTSGAAATRVLSGVRSVSMTAGGAIRLRCNIDWLMRPGDTVQGAGHEFEVGYVNYYVPGNDQYMDVGSA